MIIRLIALMTFVLLAILAMIIHFVINMFEKLK